jgi:hypothetical protein
VHRICCLVIHWEDDPGEKKNHSDMYTINNDNFIFNLNGNSSFIFCFVNVVVFNYN